MNTFKGKLVKEFYIKILSIVDISYIANLIVIVMQKQIVMQKNFEVPTS